MRAAKPNQEFNLEAPIAANFARPPIDDGAAAQAAARMFANLGSTLARLAGDAEKKRIAAEVDEATRQGATAGAGAIGLTSWQSAGGAKPLPKTGGGADIATQGKAGETRAAIIRNSAALLGADPIDLATMISYETGGTFSTSIFGGAGNAYLGLIQFGPEEQARYGVKPGQSFGQQMQSVVAYLKDRGFKPGMGLLDLYSTVNAGQPGKYGASDRPGFTVASHVDQMSGGHRANALAVLGGSTGSPQFVMPEIRPLQLRRDGTPQGAAYDDALLKAGAYRAKAAMTTGLGAIADEFANDPAEFEKQAAELRKRYLTAFAAVPELAATADAEFELNYEPVRRQVYAARDQAADKDMQDAAATAVAAQATLLEKQAYAIGIQADGDAQLAALASRAINVIDAAVQAGGVKPTDAVKRREEVLNRLVKARLDGVFDNLNSPAEKAAFAEGLKDDWVSDTPIGRLPRADFNAIVTDYASRAKKAEDELDAAARLDKARFARLIADDVASMGATGEGVKVGGLELDGNEVARIAGPEAAEKWAGDRLAARALFWATDGMKRQTEDQIATRLAGLEPGAGAEGFAVAKKVQEDAAKLAAAILKQRIEDPAAAVEEALPGLGDEDLRKDPQKLVQARLDAQASLGIEELARAPLTNREAGQLAKRFTLYENNIEAQIASVDRLVAEIDKTYGVFGDEVMLQLLRQSGVSKEAAAPAVELMRKLGMGQAPDLSDARRFDGAQTRDQAAAAVAGQPVIKPGRPNPMTPPAGKPKRNVPNAAQVEALRKDPAFMSEAFDKRFGKDAAAAFLTPRGQPQTRRLPDGSTEIRYEDGWIEVLHPDGTIDGKQGP